jgi:hypothetical protein
MQFPLKSLAGTYILDLHILLNGLKPFQAKKNAVLPR